MRTFDWISISSAATLAFMLTPKSIKDILRLFGSLEKSIVSEGGMEQVSVAASLC